MQSRLPLEGRGKGRKLVTERSKDVNEDGKSKDRHLTANSIRATKRAAISDRKASTLHGSRGEDFPGFVRN